MAGPDPIWGGGSYTEVIGIRVSVYVWVCPGAGKLGQGGGLTAEGYQAVKAQWRLSLATKDSPSCLALPSRPRRMAVSPACGEGRNVRAGPL